MPRRTNPVVARNLIHGNSAGEAGGLRFCYFYVTPPPDIYENVVYQNQAIRGGGLLTFDADPTIVNCTFDQNSATDGGNAFLYSGRLVTLRNCIFTNATSGGGISGESGVQTSIESCDVWGNVGGDYLHGIVPGPGCINEDPLFCGADASDPYTIRNTSGCVGAGLGGTDIGARGVGCFEQDRVIFYDNFSDQDDAGWEREIAGDGSISVATGEYRHSAGSGMGFARSVASGLDVGDFEYDVRVIPTAGNGRSDLFLRWRGPDEHYTVALDSSTGRLYRKRGGEDSLFVVFPCAMLDMIRYEFRIQAAGGLIRAWRRFGDGDFTLLFSFEDEDPIRRGSVGVGTEWAGETASFDNVLVLDQTDPAAVLSARDRTKLLMTSPVPNPFSASTSLHLWLAEASHARVEIFDAAGARVRSLVDIDLPAGIHVMRWDGRNDRGLPVGNGVYFCRAAVRGLRESHSVVLLRR